MTIAGAYKNESTKPPDIYIQKEKNIAKRNKLADVKRYAQNW